MDIDQWLSVEIMIFVFALVFCCYGVEQDYFQPICVKHVLGSYHPMDLLTWTEYNEYPHQFVTPF